MSERDESLRAIEHEVWVLIRRVRRIIRAVAVEVHPDLQPSSYLLLAYLHEAGPVRSTAVVDALGIDKGGSAGRPSTSSTSGWSGGPPTPPTAGLAWPR